MEISIRVFIGKYSLGTIQVLNTRVSDMNNRMNVIENSKERILAKLKLMHDEMITPKDFLFSMTYLEKFIKCR